MSYKLLLAALLAPALYAQTYVNLAPALNSDVFLEPGGAGEGSPLDQQGRRIDSATLPTSYVDGSPVTSTNGKAVFRFGPLRTAALDAVRIDGQRLDVQDGAYSSLDVALLSAPGAFVNPLPELEFHYTDGSTNKARLGPVAGWFSSPTTFDNALFRYTDQSAVVEHLSFATNGEDDTDYLIQSAGNAISGGWRFADGAGYLLYQLNVAGISSGKLGITIGNNFVVSIATEFRDPAQSTTQGYTVLASSRQIYGVEHRSLGNLKEYVFDVSQYLAAGTGQLFILLTDASRADGWGPFVQRIRLFDGAAVNFEERLKPVVDVSKATVYANFQVSSAEETPFLYDNAGSGPSNRGHRFADAGGSLTYRFNLPDDVTNAKLMVDMDNNFVVSLAGPPGGVTFAKMTPNTPAEATYLVDDGGSATQPNARFADAGAYMIYEFDLPDTVTSAFARVHVGNQFVVEAARGGETDYTLLKDYYAQTGDAVQNLSNLAIHSFDLTPFLANNPSRTVRIRLSDGIPQDGWGPYLRGIEIVESETAGAFNFTEVLNSQAMFGEDFHNEANRNYYTIDLSRSLTNNNPTRDVYVRFTDGTTSDGWGPGLYWMAAYTGEIDVKSDSLVFPALKTTTGEPASRPVGLIARNYPLNPAKTLSAIKLPSHPLDQSSAVYLLAATLNTAAPQTPPRLSAVAIAGNKIRLSWPAAQGFQLMVTPSLTTPIWSNAGLVAQNTDGIMSVEIDATSRSGFYRLAR